MNAKFRQKNMQSNLLVIFTGVRQEGQFTESRAKRRADNAQDGDGIVLGYRHQDKSSCGQEAAQEDTDAVNYSEVEYGDEDKWPCCHCPGAVLWLPGITYWT